MRKTVNLLLALTLLLLPALAKAQQMPQMNIDKDVRIGKLSNGLTYYIRHNEKPKGQADFYIAQKVGSVLEEDNQRGLAHFLEHMCFNGTTHYPGKNLINWLEGIGVKFGYNLNAYTGTDQTVYNISNVPVARTGVQDSCLLILHDWANDLLLLPEEIDAERGVIHQEWRRSMVGQMRILENLLPTMYPDCRYGYRLPIGTMDVVDNFEPKALRDYYEKWYRPDLQGIIVVGDIDVDYIEGKIKEMFSDIEMPENPAERIYFPVNDTKGTIYAIGHDKEQTNCVAQLMIKTDVIPAELRNTMAFYAQKYVSDIICQMMDTRLNDISSKPGSPFAAAGLSYGQYFLAKTKDATQLFTLAGTSEELPKALAGAYRELLRAVRGGFTDSEYTRARSEYLSRYEKAYNNREARENEQFVNEYVDNFVDGDPIPPIEEEYQTVQMIANSIPVSTINDAIKELVTPDNRVLLVLMPDNAEGKYPTEADFKAALEGVDAEEIEAFKEEVKSEPLIEKLRPAGKIVSEKHNAQWDATEMTLSNGVKVYVKHTDFKNDEIMMKAFALNGTSTIKAAPADIIFFPAAARAYGLGSYTNADLQKYLAGKQASVHVGFQPYYRTVNGNTTPKDLSTMMELLYSVFTQFNFSADEYKALQDTYAGILANQASNPQYIFQTKVMESLYTSPLLRALSAQYVSESTREGVIDIARKMTANAADYTFTFVGNTDMETLRPLIEKYIASLPADAKAAKANAKVKFDKSLNPVMGTHTSEFTAAMQTPQTWVYVTQFGTLPYNSKDVKLASILGQVLSKRLLDIVREKEGAVYSIGAQASMDEVDPINVELLSAFPMKPEMKDKVLRIIREQIDDLAKNISKEEVDKAKEYMAKNHKDNLEQNAAWLSAMRDWQATGVDKFHDYLEVLNPITPADVQDFAKRLISQGNYHVIVLDPAE